MPAAADIIVRMGTSDPGQRGPRPDDVLARLLRIVDGLPNGAVYSIVRRPDGSSYFEHISAGVEQMLGVSPAEALADVEAIHGLILPEDRGRYDEGGARSAATLTPFDGEFRMRTRGGEVKWVRCRSAPHRLPDGGTRFDGLVLDETDRALADQERARLEERLLSAQKLESLGLLAGGIAHDFNNLLTGVMTEAGLALGDVPPGSSVQASLRAIETAARRMSELTKQLLAYAGGGKLSTERIDAARLVAEMVELLRRNVDRDARLDVDLARAPGGDGGAIGRIAPAIVEADPTQLRQVIMNLVLNASDALQGRRGEILVRSWSEACVAANAPGVWVLEVSDTGCGMDAETRRRIFDPFFTTKGRGRGLGLSAVLGIVQGLSGQIDVESEPGRGTTFRLRVPLSPGQEAPASTGEVPSVSGPRRLRVLVVDDEEAVRITLSRVLGRRGHAISVAVDGADAIEVFRKAGGAFDLVLLDISMPRKNGYQVLQELRAIRPDIRVVLMSGYSEQHLAGMNGSGAAPRPDGFLEKPFTVEVIDRVLAQTRR